MVKYTRWKQVEGKVLAKALFEEAKKRIIQGLKNNRNHTRLYAVLAYRYLNKGVLYDPSLSLISPLQFLSDELECSQNTISRHIKKLVQLHFRFSWSEVVMRERLQTLGVTLKDISQYCRLRNWGEGVTV